MSLAPPPPFPLPLPLPLPSIAAAPPPFSLYRTKQIYYDNKFYFVPPLPILDSVFDLATLSLIAAILLLSLLSICFIFHLRFKTRTSPLLRRHFNTLWTVRFLLVFLIICWALNELLRLPFFRRRYLYPFLPSSLTSSSQLQTNFCKVQVVLSLGFFEPGFLVILLFLVKVSIKKRNSYNKWSFAAFFAASCLPLLLLQAFAVLFEPPAAAEKLFHLRPMFQQCWIILRDEFDGRETVFCTYPLLSTTVFAAFGVAYSLGFLISCWKVVSVVINKGLRVRIYTLACTVLISLSLQIVFLGLSSVLWRPEETRAYGGVCLVIFLTVLSCAAVGEGILVISPIADTLSAGGDCCRLSFGHRSPPEVGQKRVVNGCGL